MKKFLFKISITLILIMSLINLKNKIIQNNVSSINTLKSFDNKKMTYGDFSINNFLLEEEDFYLIDYNKTEEGKLCTIGSRKRMGYVVNTIIEKVSKYNNTKIVYIESDIINQEMKIKIVY